MSRSGVGAFSDVVNGLADDNHAGFRLFHVPQAHRQRRQGDSLFCLHMQLRQDQAGFLLARLLGLASSQRAPSQRLFRRRNRPAGVMPVSVTVPDGR